MAEQDEHLNSAESSPPAAQSAVDGTLLSRAALTRILPFLTYIVFIVAHDLLQRFGWTAAELRWLYPVKITAVVLLLAVFWRQYTELHRPSLGPATALVALAAGMFMFVLWISLSAPWMVLGAAQGFDPHTGGQIDWLLVALRLCGAVLVVPIMEELFWRSFLLRSITAADFERVDPARIGFKAVLVSVTLFGFEHHLWLAGIAAGAVFTFLYVHYRTLWSPILAHALTNAALGAWIVATGNWTFW
jgi:CAAX prenyl protease-like protein